MTEHPNLSAALVAALAELTVVEKGRTADAGSYKYEYADLGDIVKEARPKLAAHGLAVLTPVCDHGDGLAVTVLLLHQSGERLEFGPLSFPHGRDAQATGSLITYHRRYALLSALGMATGDDDDGASAVPRQAAQKPAEPNPRADELIDRLSVLPEDAQTKILNWFNAPVEQWATFSDTALDKLAEQIAKAETAARAAVGQEQDDTGNPGPEVAAPASTEPLVRPAENSPVAAARAALDKVKAKEPAA